MKRYIVFLLSVFLLSSCISEILLPAVESGVPVRVSLSIKIPMGTSTNTPISRSSAVPPSDSLPVASAKGNGFSVRIQPDTVMVDTIKGLLTRSGGNRKLYNLWVFQFDQDGKKRKVIKIPDTPEPIKDLIVIDAELLSGTNQTIYLVAMGSEYGHVDLNEIATKEELESYSLPLFKPDDTPIVTTDEQMPYRGSYDGLTIAQDANGTGYLRFSDNIPFTGGIPMTAMLARVTLDFAFNVNEATEQSIILSNIATSYPIKPSGTYKPSSFNNRSITINPTEKTPEGRYVYTWYFAPNPQGKVPSITRQEERIRAANFFHPTQPGIPVGNAPEDATHLVVWSKHNTQNRYVLYYIYPGTNLSDDFNLFPGSSYTLRTDIDAIDSPDDLRIISAPLTQSLFFRSSNTKGTPDATWLKINGDNNFGSDRYDLDAHPCRRPIEIFVLKGDVKISVTAGASWLHLSRYPNYTAAKQAQQAGKSDGLTNIISVHAKIPTHYKFYLYADEYENYTTGNLAHSVNKRQGTIRFDIATLDGTGTTNVSTYINQRSAFLVGRMGGDFNYNTGEYSEYLAYEAIPEYYEFTGKVNTPGYFYSDYLPYYPLDAAIFKTDYDTDPRSWTPAQRMDYYNTDDLYNGKIATRLLAEGNQGGFLWINTGYAFPVRETESPRWVNGKLDLYQYQDEYHKRNGGFSFRACFDRNRDENGNGVIDPEEYHWYTPSFAQLHIAIGYNQRGWNPYIDNKQQQSPFRGEISTTITASEATGSTFPLAPALSALTSLSYTMARCVRNVSNSTLDVSSSPKQPKISTVTNDGDSEVYAVIDATGLRAGTSSTNYTNYDKVNGSQKATYVYDAGANGIRTVRHTLDGTASSVVSSRFMVAPVCIHGDTGIDWAAASGWSNTANGNSSGNVTAVSGCAAYQGRNGTDAQGTWRLPTSMEMLLICIYNEVLLTTAPQTGYEAIVPLYHWTSSESSATGAYMLTPRYKVGSSKIAGITSTNSFTKSRSTMLTGAKIAIRCIKDIPLEP